MGEAETLIIGIVLVFVVNAVFTYFKIDDEKIDKIFRLNQ